MKELIIPVPMNAYDLIPEILGASFEYWYWWKQYGYDEGYNWNELPDDPNQKFLELTALDPDDEEEERTITKKVSVMDIANAFVASQYRNWNDLDAGASDYIMQHAMYGEAIWA